MRLVIANCSVDYAGRLSAHLPLAKRLLMIKADGSLLVHSDGGSYKPLNWMSPPCTLTVDEPDDLQREAGITHMRIEGTSRYLSIRRADLDRRFPGLLDSVIEAAQRDPGLPRISEEPATKP